MLIRSLKTSLKIKYPEGPADMATAARCFISAAAVDRGQCSVMTGF